MAEADGSELVGMTVLPQKLVQRSDQETDAMAGPWVLLVTAQVPAGSSTRMTVCLHAGAVCQQGEVVCRSLTPALMARHRARASAYTCQSFR